MKNKSKPKPIEEGVDHIIKISVKNYSPIKTLDNFLGNPETKKQMKEIVTQIEFPQMYYMLGSTPDKAFLFCGPPGNGKTHGVECIVGELTDRDKKIMKMNYDIGRYGTAYINMGSRQLQSFFDEGKRIIDKTTDYHAMFYLFDEAEVLMGKRGGMQTHKEDDKLLETLMKNMQRIHDESENEYLFFTTNLKKLMDKAAMRTHRIDKHIEFTNPNKTSREELLDYAIKSTNKRAGYSVVRNINLRKLAELTNGFNCADMEDIPRRAVKKRVTRMLQSRTNNRIPQIYVKQNGLVQEINYIKLVKQKERKVGFK